MKIKDFVAFVMINTSTFKVVDIVCTHFDQLNFFYFKMTLFLI